MAQACAHTSSLSQQLLVKSIKECYVHTVCACVSIHSLSHISHECNSGRVYSLFFLNLIANLKRSIHTSYTPTRVARRMPVAYACACLWHTVIWRRVSVNAPGTTALREKLRKTFPAGLPLCIHSNATGGMAPTLTFSKVSSAPFLNHDTP